MGTAIVTGANSGLGYEITRRLARAGHPVVMACHSADRGDVARLVIEKEQHGAALAEKQVDLSEMASAASRGEGRRVSRVPGLSRDEGIGRRGVATRLRDEAAAARLWDLPAAITGAEWPGLAPTSARVPETPLMPRAFETTGLRSTHTQPLLEGALP